jgi:hypothetical protein
MSTPPSIQLTLYAGNMVLSAVPSFVAEAWQSLAVTYSDEAPAAFQLTFHADRNQQLQSDYSLVSCGLLRPGNRLAATVTLNGQPQIVMDGFITNQELSHTTSFGASTLSITAEDVSILMDLHQVSDQYPGLTDALIVAKVLAPYIVFGIMPLVVPPLTTLVSDPFYYVPKQDSTDRAYLQQLAQPYAFVFCVRPGPSVGVNTAYWGPPLRMMAAQPALTVNVGPASNVQSMSFTHRAATATFVHGFVDDDELDVVLPVVTIAGSRTPALATQSALPSDFPLIRSEQFSDDRPTAVRAYVEAQATTDRSLDDVVVCQGQLDVLRYGALLQAPGVVGVRGVGVTYDGLYYVQQVTHRVSRASYTQEFTLKREGVGTTVSSVAV